LRGSPLVWSDPAFGWNYLRERPGFFGLLRYYTAVNFFLSLSGVLTSPLMLSFGESTDLGVVQMAGGAAMLIGGIATSAWGGPQKRRIWAVIAAIALSRLARIFFGGNHL
jgi:hypothetical protein